MTKGSGRTSKVQGAKRKQREDLWGKSKDNKGRTVWAKVERVDCYIGNRQETFATMRGIHFLALRQQGFTIHTDS